MNNKDYYFSIMRETSEKVFPVFLDLAEQIKRINEELFDTLMIFIGKRRGGLLLRPLLIRLSYEICGAEKWEKIVPVCAAFELLNISSYQANSAFDAKAGVLSQDAKNSQFIASMITRELCMEVLLKTRGVFGRETISALAEMISRSNKYMYIAQHYDLNMLTVENANKYIDHDDLFMEDYIKRCYYGCGIFSGDCARAGALLSGASNDKIKALITFGENYGVGLQVINDLADFAPYSADERQYQDQYSDLRNGRLTFALYKLFKIRSKLAHGICQKISNKEHFTDEELHEISDILMKRGVVNSAKSLAVKYATNAKRPLKIFSEGGSKELLFIMTSICGNNKYLECFADAANT